MHLKNPSITEIRNYFDKYYRPNNVDICMSGELEYAKTISLIDKHFGDWKKISKLFEKHFKSIAPKGVKVEVKTHHGGGPYVTPTDSVAFKAAEKAYNDVFGTKPHAKRDGGSIPIVPMFEKVLGSKTLLMGFGFDSDAIHSPNEHYGIDNFLKGIETIALFYTHYNALKRNE